MHTHTHTSAHAHAAAHAHAHECTRTCTRTRVHTHLHTHTSAHAPAHVRAHTHVSARAHTHIRVRTHIHTPVRALAGGAGQTQPSARRRFGRGVVRGRPARRVLALGGTVKFVGVSQRRESPGGGPEAGRALSSVTPDQHPRTARVPLSKHRSHSFGPSGKRTALWPKVHAAHTEWQGTTSRTSTLSLP
jgi:hypothetical protein